MSSRTLLVIGLVLVAGFCAAAWAKDAPVLLEKGLHEEETAGDLDKAIGTYQQIVEQSEAERGQVAEARYRLGMCYLKKGEKEKAQQAFESLLKLYPDQTKLVEASRAELNKLAPPRYGPAAGAGFGGGAGGFGGGGIGGLGLPEVPGAAAAVGSLSAARIQLADVEAEVVGLKAEAEAKHYAVTMAENRLKVGQLPGGGQALENAKAELVKAEAQLKAAQEKKKILEEEVARLSRRSEGAPSRRFLHGAKPLVGEIPAGMRGPLDQKANLTFDQTPLFQVVYFLQQVTGVQFVLFTKDLPPDQAPVTLTYTGTLEQALNLICELTDLSWTVDGNVIKIGARERFEPLPSAAPMGPPAVPGGMGGFGGGLK